MIKYFYELSKVLKKASPDTSFKCPLCNLEFKETIGYVCPRSNCPTGLGGSTSKELSY